MHHPRYGTERVRVTLPLSRATALVMCVEDTSYFDYYNRTRRTTPTPHFFTPLSTCSSSSRKRRDRTAACWLRNEQGFRRCMMLERSACHDRYVEGRAQEVGGPCFFVFVADSREGGLSSSNILPGLRLTKLNLNAFFLSSVAEHVWRHTK